jgi:predicted RNA-binding Zn ribbon-like protein
MLAPIVRGAADLLIGPDRARVRECGSDTCFWLFLDHSKNGTRRWCDMKVCGNRAKARRHYQRGRETVARRRRGERA